MKEVNSHSCPNILELIETFEDNDCYYVVTKFMPAGDLFNFISKQETVPLNENITRRIIGQVCKGIQALHARNIIHRDIKIENILMSNFSEDSQVRIADLGSAVKLDSAEGKSNFQIGTPGYMAPEILQGIAYSFGCDIWSIGSLMFVLLTAQLPFWDNSRRERKRKVCNEVLDFDKDSSLRTLSSEAKDLLTGMLRKDMSERLTIDQVLAHPWLAPEFTGDRSQ